MRGTHVFLLAAAAVAGIGTHAGAQTPRPPNILLVLTDDLGYGDLSSYGHRDLKTPVIDRLATDGMRFTSYYASAPLCSPSRAAMMTGRTPFRSGIQSWIPPATDIQLGRGEITIATLLAARGYQTMLSGKWHLNGGLDVPGHAQPGDHGFQYWLALHGWAIPHHKNPTNFFRNGKALGEVPGFAAQIVVDEAMAWLDRRRPEAPFFLFLSFAEPHSTIANPDRFNAIYARFTDGVPDPFPNADVPARNLAARGPGEYYASIAHLDFQLGRLLDHLDTLGLRENTLVVFTSDNGAVTTDWRQWYEVNLYGSTGNLRGRKGDLYDGGIRVPAIVRWPGHVRRGSVTDTPAIGYDLMPTLAAAAGASPPADRPIDGESLLPLLTGRPFSRREPLYWEFHDTHGFHFAVRDGRWKLLADNDLARVQLYDLQTDRFEVVDVAAANRDVVARLVEFARLRHGDVVRDPLRPVTPPLR